MNANKTNQSLGLATGLLAALLVLAGCSVAPTYQRPDVTTPAAFKEAPQLSAEQEAKWKSGPARRRSGARRMVEDLQRRDAEQART